VGTGGNWGRRNPLEAPCSVRGVLFSIEHLNQARRQGPGPCHIRLHVEACPCDTARRELWKTNPFPGHAAPAGLELLLPLWASDGSWGHLGTGSFGSSASSELSVDLHPQCPAHPWVRQALIKVLDDSSVFSRPLGLVKPDRKSCRNGFSCLNPSQARFEDYLEIAGRQSWWKKFPQFEPWLGTGSWAKIKSGFLKS